MDWSWRTNRIYKINVEWTRQQNWTQRRKSFYDTGDDLFQEFFENQIRKNTKKKSPINEAKIKNQSIVVWIIYRTGDVMQSRIKA